MTPSTTAQTSHQSDKIHGANQKTYAFAYIMTRAIPNEFILTRVSSEKFVSSARVNGRNSACLCYRDTSEQLHIIFDDGREWSDCEVREEAKEFLRVWNEKNRREPSQWIVMSSLSKLYFIKGIHDV